MEGNWMANLLYLSLPSLNFSTAKNPRDTAQAVL